MKRKMITKRKIQDMKKELKEKYDLILKDDIYHQYFDIIEDLFFNSPSIPKLHPPNETEQDIGLQYLWVYYYKLIAKDIEKAIYHLNIAASNGSSIAMKELGDYYSSIQNFELMKHFYLMAIEVNNIEAMERYASYCFYTKDYVSMKKYLLMAIQANNSDAMIGLGFYYYQIKDYENMLVYYQMAAEQGNSEGFVRLGMYFQELKDFDMMVQYYLKAIDLGNVVAMEKLGREYYRIKDFDHMKIYLEMAVEHGNIEAINDLATYYSITKNYPKMIEYYNLSIDKGNTDAMNNLAYFYQQKRDYGNMLKYYSMAANKGNSIAMYNLGCYYQSLGDLPEMIHYYELAIEKDNIDAMVNLGYYFESVEDNPNMIKYYTMAAEKFQDKDAMIQLALFYKKNNDYHKMAFYLLQTVDLKDPLAFNNLFNSFLPIGTENDAVFCTLIMAANLGCGRAHYQLALAYQKIQLYSTMEYHFLQAIEHSKDPDAMLGLGLYYRDIAFNYQSMKFFFLEFFHLFQTIENPPYLIENILIPVLTNLSNSPENTLASNSYYTAMKEYYELVIQELPEKYRVNKIILGKLHFQLARCYRFLVQPESMVEQYKEAMKYHHPKAKKELLDLYKPQKKVRIEENILLNEEIVISEVEFNRPKRGPGRPRKQIESPQLSVNVNNSPAVGLDEDICGLDI